jgi:hypothetical protein
MLGEALGRFYDGFGSNIVVFCWPHYYLHGRIIAREYVDKLDNQAYPMVQKLFQNDDAVFQDNNFPIHTAALNSCTMNQVLQSALR